MCVPPGNVYIERHCRKLTGETGRSVYSDERKMRIDAHIPKEVLEKAKSDYGTFMTRTSKNLWLRLQRQYPKMPLADKTAVHRRISSEHMEPQMRCFIEPIPKCSKKELESRVYSHVWPSSRTPVESLVEKDCRLNIKRVSELHKKVRDTLAYWRGETKGMESHQLGAAERPTAKEETIHSI